MKRVLLFLTIMATGLGAAEPPANNDPQRLRGDDAETRELAELRLAQGKDEDEPAEEDTEDEAVEEPDELRSKSPPERFIPSEKISADSSVSFPVDI